MKDSISQIYFLGIGGIGMSGLAFYFLKNGYRVAGYDRQPSLITSSLVEKGAQIHFQDDPHHIPDSFKKPDKTLVVFTPAIPKNAKERLFYESGDYIVMKRAAVLGELSRQMFCVAVAGTHGKTTTTAILTHLLQQSGKKITAFLGGVSTNLKSNVLMEGNEVLVVEADEFDRSFLQLQPDLACVTSMDADHLDVYGNYESLKMSFEEFIKKLPSPNNAFIREQIPLNGQYFGMSKKTAIRVSNIRIDRGAYAFDLYTTDLEMLDLHCSLPGHHNLMNTVAALAIALKIGCSKTHLRDALLTFKGVDRRFSKRLEVPKVVIDDYAHHPTEIRAMHQAVRSFYPEAAILAVFQPHLFSRTQDFCDDFAMSLSDFDEVILLDIYPARELPISGVTSDSISKKMTLNNVMTVSKPELPFLIHNSQANVVVIMGAGDIAMEVNPIVEYLKKSTNVA